MFKHTSTCTSSTCQHLSHFSFLLGGLAFAIAVTGIAGMSILEYSKNAEKPVVIAPITVPEQPIVKAYPTGARTTLTILSPDIVTTSLIIAP